MTKKETIKALSTGQNMSSSKKGSGVPFDLDPLASIEQNLDPPLNSKTHIRVQRPGA